jgi:hypothetical protein
MRLYVFVNYEYYPECTMYIYIYIYVCVYKRGPETVKLILATPIIEFETVKPRGVVPVERKVKVSSDIQLVRIGLTKSVDCKHGNRMDWFVPARASRQNYCTPIHHKKKNNYLNIITVYRKMSDKIFSSASQKETT